MASEPASNPFSPKKAFAILLLAPLAALLLFSEHQGVLAVFFTALLLWFTEAVPLPVTALLVPVAISVFGLLPAKEVFAPFGDEILYLFLGCFLMGISMAKHGFDRRVAYWLLGKCLPGNSLFSINVVIAGASYFVSMWISNTAATAIMCAVTIGVLDSLREKLKDERVIHSATVRLLLSCAFAASIGGLATPIGSPPNLIALKFLKNAGIHISFVHWMALGIPVSLLMLAVLFVVFEWRYPVRGVRVEAAREYFSEALRKLGPMKRGEIQIAAVFLIAVFFWIAPGLLVAAFPDNAWLKSVTERYSMSVVAILGGIAMFFLPVVDESGRGAPNLEGRALSEVEWGTILLFGGGLALGNLLDKSGAARDFGTLVFHGGGMTLPLLVGTIIVVSILLSEFASNTAASAILIPLVIGAAKSTNMASDVLEALVLCAAFSASFGFMLPVSTPPNAIAYGTGRIRSQDMIRTGMWFDLAGALLIGAFVAALLTFSGS